MKIPYSDRLLSVVLYFTFGLFSIVVLAFSYVAKKRISPYLNFNIFQSIFISLLLYAISKIYEAMIGFLSAIPFVDKLAEKFYIFFNGTPIFFGCTISGLLITMLVIYLSILCIIGKRPFIPFVSDIVMINTERR